MDSIQYSAELTSASQTRIIQHIGSLLHGMLILQDGGVIIY